MLTLPIFYKVYKVMQKTGGKRKDGIDFGNTGNTTDNYGTGSVISSLFSIF